MTHPNAFTAAVTTAIATGALWLAHRLGYANLTTAQAVVAAGALISAVLFVGKRGVRPLLTQIWDGAKKTAVGPPSPP